MTCNRCGCHAPDDPATGYRADRYCPDCQRIIDDEPTPVDGCAEPRTLRVVCAWCQTEMRPGVEPVTHGICEACYAEWFPSWHGVS